MGPSNKSRSKKKKGSAKKGGDKSTGQSSAGGPSSQASGETVAVSETAKTGNSRTFSSSSTVQPCKVIITNSSVTASSEQTPSSSEAPPSIEIINLPGDVLPPGPVTVNQPQTNSLKTKKKKSKATTNAEATPKEFAEIKVVEDNHPAFTSVVSQRVPPELNEDLPEESVIVVNSWDTPQDQIEADYNSSLFGVVSPKVSVSLTNLKENKMKEGITDLSNLLDNLIIDCQSNESKPKNQSNTSQKPSISQAKGPENVAVKQTATIKDEKISFEKLEQISTAEQEKEMSEEEKEALRKARKDAKKTKKTKADLPPETEDHKRTPSKEEMKVNIEPKEQSSKSEVTTTVENSSSAAPVQEKSKAELKRERREKQEAQRLAKQQAKAQPAASKNESTAQNVPAVAATKPSTTSTAAAPSSSETVAKKDKKTARQLASAGVPVRQRSSRKVPLFSHLPEYEPDPDFTRRLINCPTLHQSIVEFGTQLKEGSLDGSDTRCIAMLKAFIRVIATYRTPEAKDLSRDLSAQIKPYISFLGECRQKSISMSNAIRYLKKEINEIDPSLPEVQAKEKLITSIKDYIRENIVLAGKSIAQYGSNLLKDGDVVLTYGFSALVYEVIAEASRLGRRLKVVVLDSREPQAGTAMVVKLSQIPSVSIHYALLSDMQHVMDMVTQVIVEAESVTMNGAVQTVCGGAYVAMNARYNHKPVIVLCETYKFCNSVCTDSLVINELGDPDRVARRPNSEINELDDWRDSNKLNVINLRYDVMPACLVTALVTEQNVLPTDSVPVIIRRQYADILGQD